MRIELLTNPSGVEFDECYARRKVAVLDGVEVSLIGLSDLRINKIASGRPKDVLDAAELEQQKPARKKPAPIRKKRRKR